MISEENKRIFVTVTSAEYDLIQATAEYYDISLSRVLDSKNLNMDLEMAYIQKLFRIQMHALK